MRSVVLLLAALLVRPLAAAAGPSAGVFGTYTFTHPDFDSGRLSAGDHLNGWSAGVELPIAGVLGAVARVDAGYGASFKTGPVFVPFGATERSTTVDVVGGPMVSGAAGRLSPWASAVFGVTHATIRSMGVDALSPATSNVFTFGGGGGIDVRLARHFDVRAIAVEFRRATILDAAFNRTTVSAGMIWRLPAR